MRIDPLSSEALGFAAFRILYFVIGLVGLSLLWRRPRPQAALALILGLNLGAWAAYVLPLGRLHALDEQRDRAFNVGMAACVAAGSSAWDHTQVGYAGLEPFWSLLTAALAGFDPARVMSVYGWLTPLSLLVVGLGLYAGLRIGKDDDDRWERVLIVFAALGLSSFSMSWQPPVPALWAGNFLLKPNHACGFGLVGAGLGLRARGARWWLLGLVMGLLAWVFLLHWAYLAAGLVVALGFEQRGQRRFKSLVAALALSLLIAAPQIANLARDFLPQAGESADQVWAMDTLGRTLALPNWVTLDLGPLLVLGIAGALVLRRRGSERDRLLLGLLAATWLAWGALAVGSLYGFAPEPDELHYFLRLTMAVAAAAALAALAGAAERTWALRPGQGHVLVMAALLVLTFPAYWDPPTMDRYYPWSVPALDKNVVAYGGWVRDHTPRDAVFLAGPSSSSWIPALAGRRVLLTGDARPPSNYGERKAAERTLLRSRNLDLIRQAARAFGVTYLAIDRPLAREHRLEQMQPESPAYEQVFANPAVRIYRVP